MMSAERLHTTFYHGFGDRADLTDLGRQLQYDACTALNMTKMSILLEEAVKAGRLHYRKAELYHAQAGALLAQLTSDMKIQDPGQAAEKSGEVDGVGKLRHALVPFTKIRPENEADYASIGRNAIITAHRMLAAVPPTNKEST